MGQMASKSQVSSAVAPNSDQGKAVYEQNCALCHGKEGQVTNAGKSIGTKDLRITDVQRLSDDKIREQITEGRGDMPSFASLHEAEIDSLIRYIRTLRATPEISR